MDQQQMHRADFVTAIALLAFSIAALVQSIQMPRLEHRNINPYTAPGIVPGLLATIIGLLALVLLARSVAHGGFRLGVNKNSLGAWIRSDGIRRIGLTILLSVTYSLVLIGRVHYVIATIVYIFLFIVVFEWRWGESFAAQRRTLIIASIQAVIAAVAIAVLFQYLFLVRLP